MSFYRFCNFGDNDFLLSSEQNEMHTKADCSRAVFGYVLISNVKQYRVCISIGTSKEAVSLKIKKKKYVDQTTITCKHDFKLYVRGVGLKVVCDMLFHVGDCRK